MRPRRQVEHADRYPARPSGVTAALASLSCKRLYVGRVFRLGGVGGAAALPPCPPWLNAWAGTEPERSGGGVRLMLNRVN